MKTLAIRSCVIAAILLRLFSSNCTATTSEVKQEVWGKVDQSSIYLYTLTNANGMIVKISNFGGVIQSVFVPDKNGKLEDVVLGFDNLKQYTEKHPFFGSVIGRFANRIKDATFTIDGTTYHLTKNNGEQCIHGGGEFNNAVWAGEVLKSEEGNSIKLHYLSKDGQNGFPGNLDVYVTYALTDQNALKIKFEATTDKPTYVDMTQHSYFNLNGCKNLVSDHLVRIAADLYTEFDDDVVATGNLLPLKGKAWDLNQTTRLGDQINNIPLKGYHHCYVLNKEKGELKLVAEVLEPKSGRTLKVSTTQPGIVFYVSQALQNDITGKYGIKYPPYIAFCMETEGLPNSPHHPNMPSALLRPGEKYNETTIYEFGVVKK